jgi:hypothetical protein
MKVSMVMVVSGDTEITDPTDQQMREHLASFDDRTVSRGEAFLILGSTDTTYIQTSGDKENGFDVEYQEGGTEHHYRAARTDFTLDEVAGMLCAYRDGNPDWKDMAQWERSRW